MHNSHLGNFYVKIISISVIPPKLTNAPVSAYVHFKTVNEINTQAISKVISCEKYTYNFEQKTFKRVLYK